MITLQVIANKIKMQTTPFPAKRTAEEQESDPDWGHNHRDPMPFAAKFQLNSNFIIELNYRNRRSCLGGGYRREGSATGGG